MSNSEDKVIKSPEHWARELDPETYKITREKGTERPFTGEYNDCKQRGTYECRCCGQPLFNSDSKYDSGSGWPSFYQALNPEAIDESKDISLMMVRTEILCSRCDAHLGHVFPDGPQPTGMRYCVNSASLSLKEEK